MTRHELETMDSIIRIADSMEKISKSLDALVKQNEQLLALSIKR